MEMTGFEPVFPSVNTRGLSYLTYIPYAGRKRRLFPCYNGSGKPASIEQFITLIAQEVW